jgi:cytochrome P450
MPVNCPVVDFDHAATHPRETLLQWAERLREDAPIAWSEANGGVWIVSRYKDIVAIARNTAAFVSGKGITVPPLQSPVPVVPAESDEPEHSHYRSVLMQFLLPEAVKKHAEKIRTIVVEAMQEILKRGEGDAVRDFAAKIPTRAMAVVFGFTDEDGYRFDRDFGEVMEAAASSDPQRQMDAVASFFGFLREKLDEGRANLQADNVVSAMLAYEKNGKSFNEDECLGLLWSTAGGAVDTTKHSIGHLFYNLGINKDVRQRIKDDPSLINSAVEENLRLDAPAYMVGRHLVEDVTIDGVTMKAGERVMLVWGWANRDPEAFACPAEFDPTRKPNRHLAFGHGIHQCVGMHLARLEIRIVLEEMLKRMPDYELVDPGVNPRIHGGMMWSFDELPIRVR